MSRKKRRLNPDEMAESMKSLREMLAAYTYEGRATVKNRRESHKIEKALNNFPMAEDYFLRHLERSGGIPLDIAETLDNDCYVYSLPLHLPDGEKVYTLYLFICDSIRNFYLIQKPKKKPEYFTVPQIQDLLELEVDDVRGQSEDLMDAIYSGQLSSSLLETFAVFEDAIERALIYVLVSMGKEPGDADSSAMDIMMHEDFTFDLLLQMQGHGVYVETENYTELIEGDRLEKILNSLADNLSDFADDSGGGIIPEMLYEELISLPGYE
jgi:hypothetical protein